MSHPEQPPAGPPEFPQEFVRDHCLKVLTARDWRKNLGLPPDPEDDEAHAECAFNPAGFGLECENCRKFICDRGEPRSKADSFEGPIRQYYRDFEAWEKEEEKRRAEIVTTDQARGAFI